MALPKMPNPNDPSTWSAAERHARGITPPPLSPLAAYRTALAELGAACHAEHDRLSGDLVVWSATSPLDSALARYAAARKAAEAEQERLERERTQPPLPLDVTE